MKKGINILKIKTLCLQLVTEDGKISWRTNNKPKPSQKTHAVINNISEMMDKKLVIAIYNTI